MKANTSKKLINLLKKNITLVLFAAILLVIFNKYLVAIVLIILLSILGFITLQVSRIVPHISIETVTAGSILLGYIYDWKIALAILAPLE